MISIRPYSRRLANPLLILLPADLVVAFVSLYVAAWIRFGFDLTRAETLLGGSVAARAASFAVCIVVGLVTMGLYRSRQRPTLWEGAARVLAGVIVGGLAHVLFFYLFPFHNTGRLTLAIGVALTFLLVSMVRLALLRLLDSHPAKRRVLIVGSGRVAAKVSMLRRRSDRRRFDVVGYLPCSESEREFALKHQIGPLFDSDAAVEQLQFDEVIVGLDDRRGAFPTRQLLRHRYLGVPVRDIVDFLEEETGKLDLDVLHPGWLIFSSSGHGHLGLRTAKRVMDILAATTILVFTMPLFAAAAIGIWVEDGRKAPLLYRQRRVGRGGVVFQLLKFRSMHMDAEKHSGPRWASRSDDDRVTRTGRLIRRFRIDELPQLINVIRGEMSIVGPRPERPEFVNKLSASVPLYDYRHCVQPGLTGWAQLNFPYGASVEDASEKLKYDLFYIKNASLVFDLFILMQTLEVVIWGRAMSMAGTPSRDRALPEAGAPDAEVRALPAQRRDVA